MNGSLSVSTAVQPRCCNSLRNELPDINFERFQAVISSCSHRALQGIDGSFSEAYPIAYKAVALLVLSRLAPVALAQESCDATQKSSNVIPWMIIAICTIAVVVTIMSYHQGHVQQPPNHVIHGNHND